MAFNPHHKNGKFAVVGTYDGRCIFYTTDQLKYHTMIHVRSARGKNSQGRKVTGIEPMPGEDKVLQHLQKNDEFWGQKFMVKQL